MSIDPRLSEVGLRVLAVLLGWGGRAGPSGSDLLTATGASAGTVYPLLDRLANLGWVGSEREAGSQRELGRPLRNFWHLTHLGHAEAQARIGFLAQSAGLWAGAQYSADQERTLVRALARCTAGEADTGELARTLGWSTRLVHEVGCPLVAEGILSASRDGNETVWMVGEPGERWLRDGAGRTPVAVESSPSPGVSVG